MNVDPLKIRSAIGANERNDQTTFAEIQRSLKNDALTVGVCARHPVQWTTLINLDSLFI
jgi:hypothetical protein